MKRQVKPESARKVNKTNGLAPRLKRELSKSMRPVKRFYTRRQRVDVTSC